MSDVSLMCLRLPCHIYRAGWEVNVRLPTAAATSKSLLTVIRQESTQHPTSPPSKCTADKGMSGDSGGAVVTHGVGNGVGWVGCLHFGFTAVSLVMDFSQFCVASNVSI